MAQTMQATETHEVTLLKTGAPRDLHTKEDPLTEELLPHLVIQER